MRKKLIGRVAMGVIAAGSAAALAFTGLSSAASVQTTTNGEAGYYVFSATGYAAVTSVLTTTPESENMVPGTGADAAGIQLCDNNTGVAAQLGLIRNADGTFSVRYALGLLAGTVTDPCVGDGVLSSSSALATAALGAIPVKHQVWLLVRPGPRQSRTVQVCKVHHHWVWQYWYTGHGVKHVKHYHWVDHPTRVCVSVHHYYGSIQFQAEDLTVGASVWTSPYLLIPDHQVFYEAGAGVQRTVAHLTSGSATEALTNDLMDFTHTAALGAGGNFALAVQVQSAANGNAANPQVAPGLRGSTLLGQGTDGTPLATDHVGPGFPAPVAPVGGSFSVYEGNPVS